MKRFCNVAIIFSVLILYAADVNFYHLFEEDVIAFPVRGKVKFRKKESLRWLDIHSKTGLAVGDVIYIPKSAMIRLQMPYMMKNKNRQTVQMEFRGPQLIRVSEQMLREFELNIKAGGSTSSVLLSNSKQDMGDDQLLSLDAANQMLAGEADSSSQMIFNQSMSFQLGEVSNTKTQEQLNNSFLKTDLNIVSPESGAVIEENSLPFEVKLVWEIPKEEQNKTHAILLKEEGDEEYIEIAKTSNDFYTFQVPKPGTYEIVLQSENGEYRSESTKVLLEYSEEAEKYKSKEPIQNIRPTPNMIYYSTSLPMKINFVFKNPEKGSVKADLYIRKEGLSPKLQSVQKINIAGRAFLENELMEGKYRWTIVSSGNRPPEEIENWFKFEIRKGELVLDEALQKLVNREGGFFKEETTIFYEH